MQRNKHLQGYRITNTQLKRIGAIVAIISSLLVHYTSCHHNRPCCVTSIETCFTPHEPCMDLIVAKMLNAQESILVQAYLLTSKKIAYTLVQAHQKKVKVQLLVDKNALTSKGSKIPWLHKQGIPIVIDHTFGFAHNKVMIIDEDCVITGSFNWTDGAQTKNAENVVIIRGEASAKRFKENWYKRAAAGMLLDHTDHLY